MNHKLLASYNNRPLLVDGERFQRYIHEAITKPCPTMEQVAQLRLDLKRYAREIVPGADAALMERLRVYGFQGSGVTCVEECRYAVDEAVAKAESPRAIRATKGKVGVINIFGPVDNRMTGELDKAGGTPLDWVSSAFDSLMGNPGVGAIVFRYDSPGGAVSMVPELADKIYAARSEKPIYAISDTLMASAAFWLGSAASMVIASPSADVGSVGVYVMHVDESGSLEQDGIKVTTVNAGKYKTEFSPYSPLSEDARAEAQSRVNEIYDGFTGALSRNYGIPVADVRKNFGEGRVVSAQKALAVGMIHRVMSFESLISKLTGSATKSASGPSAEKLLALHEYEESV